MKHSDFHIGLEFIASAGLKWHCTDVGSRTVVAIRLDHDDPNWYLGPPYIVEEKVFDEHEIKRCRMSSVEAEGASMRELDKTDHPGYPVDVVDRMMSTLHDQHYPHSGVLRFDRRRPDGEILHPYGGKKEGGEWIVLLYLPFLRIFEQIAEREFIALPIATDRDFLIRSARR
jgi:hypothetical protein